MVGPKEAVNKVISWLVWFYTLLHRQITFCTLLLSSLFKTKQKNSTSAWIYNYDGSKIGVIQCQHFLLKNGLLSRKWYCIGNFSAQHLNKFDMCSNFEVAILGIWFSSFLHAPSIFEASFKLILIISEVINCNLILKSQAFWTALWSTNRSMYAFSYCLLF